MDNLALIDEYYKKFIDNLYDWIPEGVYFINLELLHHFDLLHFQPSFPKDSLVFKRFYIIESQEKVTLMNPEFIVWITPDQRNPHFSSTYILIALNQENREPKLEVAFIASGIYNSSHFVLKTLEKFLIEIQETEHALSKIQSFP